MKIIKRNGAEEIFNVEKIVVALRKANAAVEEQYRMTDLQIERIAQNVTISCESLNRSPAVEEIQDLVEKQARHAHRAGRECGAGWKGCYPRCESAPCGRAWKSFVEAHLILHRFAC